MFKNVIQYKSTFNGRNFYDDNNNNKQRIKGGKCQHVLVVWLFICNLSKLLLYHNVQEWNNAQKYKTFLKWNK